MFPSVSAPGGSPNCGASGMAPMPTLSSTIQMIRENTKFDCNMRLEASAETQPAAAELDRLDPTDQILFQWNQSLTLSRWINLIQLAVGDGYRR
jgi:hypothetical protein